jgi:poly [ADP-ribose] polymerase
MSNLRYAYLIKVDSNENNNKFYEMIEKENGTIELYNGRIQASRVKQEDKPSSHWDKIYKSKLNKQYTDCTSFRSVKEESNNSKDSKYKALSNSNIEAFINKLQSYAGDSVNANYSVKAVNVTQLMIDEAQSVINDITNKLKLKTDIVYLNDRLQYLFTIIPRKMRNVRDNLFEKINDKDALDIATKKLAKEQDILDSMAGQVIQNVSTSSVLDNSEKINKTILEDLSLTLEDGTDKDYDFVRKYMKDYDNSDASRQLYKVFKASNLKTEETFQNWIKNQKNKNTTLFWHGSRSQVWWYIYQQGLVIRPSAANGSYYGRSLYFADKYAKSRGYSSLSGSYWTNGSNSEAFLGIFEVHTGNQKVYLKHEPECYNLTYDFINKQGFDSVFAKGGADLRNNEYMVYKDNQATIRYLIWIKN